MSTAPSIAAAVCPSRHWLDVHENPTAPWPRWKPVTERPGPHRRYAWSVPGLAIEAPAVIEGRSAAGVARAVLAAARAGGTITAWRERLLLVLHELAPGAPSGALAAGTWPADGVRRHIAVSVTLERHGPIVPTLDVGGGKGVGGALA